MKRYSVACMSVIALGCISAIPENAVAITPVSCVISLGANNAVSHTCGSIPDIQFIRLGTRTTDNVPEAVVKVTLDGKIDPTNGYTQAVFEVAYLYPKDGWAVNIGDSSTNDGYKGDASTQSNDAEMQLVNHSLTIYSSDYDPVTTPLLNTAVNPIVTPRPPTPSSYLDRITIKDNAMQWVEYSEYGTAPHVFDFRSKHLFALAGQADSTGPVNYDIYAAFNRTIVSRPDRISKSVGQIRVTLK